MLPDQGVRAGHKGEFAAAAHSSTRTAAPLTADQERVLRRLEERACAADLRGVVVFELVGREVAAAVQTSMPGKAARLYWTLSIAY